MEKILVIDDNEVICDMLYDVLNEWGFCVEKAYQGMKALPLVDEFQPDLVILQPRSPSCGKGIIYDGSFQNRLVEGDGMFARLLLDEGIPVMTCGEFLEEVKPLSTKG